MERFRQDARKVLSLAHEEAEGLQHDYIGTEHLLIGMIREEGGIGGRVLRDLELESTRVKDMVERLTGVGRHSGSRIELARESEEVIQRAIQEARRRGHEYIGTEHLLLGMIRYGEGLGLDVLRRLGVTPEQILRQISQSLQETATQSVEDIEMLERDFADRWAPPLSGVLVHAVREYSRRYTVKLRWIGETIDAFVLPDLERVQSSFDEDADESDEPEDIPGLINDIINRVREIRERIEMTVE